MMKKNRKYLKPYIRRARKKDFSGKKAIDLYTAIEMGMYLKIPKCYVLVQHGSDKIITIGLSKKEIKEKANIIHGRGMNKRYNEWENKMKHYAQGGIEDERKNH